jgi:hypothetical protein
MIEGIIFSGLVDWTCYLFTNLGQLKLPSNMLLYTVQQAIRLQYYMLTDMYDTSTIIEHCRLTYVCFIHTVHAHIAHLQYCMCVTEMFIFYVLKI